MNSLFNMHIINLINMYLIEIVPGEREPHIYTI